MRRLLRDVADHKELGDVTTLADPTVVNAIGDAMAKPGGSE
jgi:acetyl-CoA synthetase